MTAVGAVVASKMRIVTGEMVAVFAIFNGFYSFIVFIELLYAERWGMCKNFEKIFTVAPECV